MKQISTSLVLMFSIVVFFVNAQSSAGLSLVKNIGQQHTNVLYSVELSNGALYAEQTCLTYVFYNKSDLYAVSEFLHENEFLNREKICPTLRGHTYKMHFKNAAQNAVIREEEMLPETHNYFLGNDATKWASNVPLFKRVLYENVYPEIDFRLYSSGVNPEYDFIVKPGAYVSDIALVYEGADGIKLSNGNLVIETSVGEIIEQCPIAFQIVNGVKNEVACHYSLSANEVSFLFPNGYNPAYELVIDPVVIAGTYSGTTYRAYAHTATYDDAGNIYSAGRAFSVSANGSGAGYPATVGAFQTSHAGGYQDICISKYNANGSSLLWATYLGGSSQEQPHSLAVNAGQELYVYGTSNSPNFPTTSGAFKTSNPTDNFGNHLNDIVVIRLSSTGSTLIGSTYVGGRSEDDGINWSTVHRYYGDYYKGEIILDSASNVYIASHTRATDFPATAGTVQPVYSGGYQDGVIFKLNSALTAMHWGTFYGGPAEDACYSLKLDAAGNLFVTGAISSNVLTNTSGTIHPSFMGGLFDAFVTHITGNGQSVIKSTYFGSINEEQAYLLDLDRNGNVYIFGATPNSSILPTPGAYQGVMYGSFISKLKPTLDSIFFISTFNQLAPTALMIDDCDYIYGVGHGGLNTSIGTLTGFTTTPDALQTGSGGFYIITLEPNGTALKFGSYYGPAESHVDGGTCRFNKQGIIYHALCTDKTNMFTTPNAYRTTKTSNDFDNCVFKIDFQAGKVKANAIATIIGSNDTTTQINSCMSPVSIQFINRSENAVAYEWHFGNGDSSSAAQPLYTYTNSGTYQVMLIAKNPATCNETDTAYISIDLVNGVLINVTSSNTSCNSSVGSATVHVNSGSAPFSFLWSNGDTDSTIINLTSGNYSVTVTGAGNCSASASVTVSSSNGVTLSTSTVNTTCGNNNGSASVSASTGALPFGYLWSSGETNATITGLASGSYTTTVTDANGCSATASITVAASQAPTPFAISADKTVMCPSDTARVCAPSGYSSYLWNTGETDTCIYTQLAGNYYVTVTEQSNCTVLSNPLGISVYPQPPVSISVNGDTLTAYNAVSYQWYLNNTVIPLATNAVYIVTEPGNYTVQITDSNGCKAVSNAVPVVNVTIGENLRNLPLVVLQNVSSKHFEMRISNFEFDEPLVALLFDALGRKIAEQKITAALTIINAESIMSGVYFVRIAGRGINEVRKIVKQ